MAFDMRRLESVDKDLAMIRTRHATLYPQRDFFERLLPYRFDPWFRRSLSVDTVVTGHNPLLAIILLKQALELGLRCLVTLDNSDDDWPYDLSTHPNTIQVVSAALGLRSSRYGQIERFYGGLVEEFIMPAAQLVTLVQRGGTLSAFTRQHDGELTLAVGRAPPCAPPTDRHRDVLAGELARSLSGCRVLANRSKTFVFCPRAILTGLSDSFAPAISDGLAISYDSPHVFAVGSAATRPVTNAQKAEAMVADVIRCARFEF